jgi:hypothetical protein
VSASLTADVIVDASPAEVWNVVTDWERQSTWMLMTNVRATRVDVPGVGDELAAFTGVGRLGLLDKMRVSEWDPPRRCVVTHTGSIVAGSGIIEVVALPNGATRLVWTELIELPFGRFGRLAWPAAREIVRLGLLISLRRVARQLSA